MTLERFVFILIAMILTAIGWGLIDAYRPREKYREPFIGAEKVVSWSGNRILLANGRSVELPLIRKIPTQAASLMEICLAEGVIIDSKNNIICRIETVGVDHHTGFWNINLSLLLGYLFDGASDVIKHNFSAEDFDRELLPMQNSQWFFFSAFSRYKQWEVDQAGKLDITSEWISESTRKRLLAPSSPPGRRQMADPPQTDQRPAPLPTGGGSSLKSISTTVVFA